MSDAATFLLVSLTVAGLCLSTLVLSFPLHRQVQSLATSGHLPSILAKKFQMTDSPFLGSAITGFLSSLVTTVCSTWELLLLAATTWLSRALLATILRVLFLLQEETQPPAGRHEAGPPHPPPRIGGQPLARSHVKASRSSKGESEGGTDSSLYPKFSKLHVEEKLAGMRQIWQSLAGHKEDDCLELVLNEAPQLTEVSLNSDDDEDIDSIVKAYRRGLALPPQSNSIMGRPKSLLLWLAGLSTGLGCLASWLAASSSAMATRPLVGLCPPLTGLVLIGCLGGIVMLCLRRRAGKGHHRTAGQLVAAMAALLLLSFHLVQFLLAVRYGLVAMAFWLLLGLLVFKINSRRQQQQPVDNNVLTVATIS